MDKAFHRKNWENEPSAKTPINAANLNEIDYGLNMVDDRVIELDITKAKQSDLLQCLSSVTYNQASGTFVFTWQNGKTMTADLNIEKIPVAFALSTDGILTMTNTDGTEYVCDIASLIRIYTFADSDTLNFRVDVQEDGSYSVSAEVKAGSITGQHFDTDYKAVLELASQEAKAAAEFSGESFQKAVQEADRAKEEADRAKIEADRASAIAGADIAALDKIGLVKPDGTTLSVDADGTMKVIGGAGTSDYEELENKPSIEGVVLSGNQTLADLGIQPKGNYPTTSYMMETMSSMCDNIDATYATKLYVAEMIAAGALRKEIVDVLPRENIDQNVIYLVPKPESQSAVQDVYNEYINLTGTESGWEYLGSTAIDLADYYNKSQCNSLFTLQTQTGTLTDLQTTEKSTLVGALNEILGKLGGCWIDFTDAEGNVTTEPYIHWMSEE